MEKVAADKDGHGVGDAQKASGKAQYTFDVPSSPIRFIVLDTSVETGGASGMIRKGDVDSFIRPALEAAKRDGKWVVMSHHHPHDNMTTDGGGLGGSPQADALTQDQYLALLGEYPNVLFNVVGHYHAHVSRPVKTPGHTFWEVITASITDFPHQFRVIEIWDGDNGFVLLRSTCVDIAVDDDPISAYGRKLGVVDFTRAGTRTTDPAPRSSATSSCG
jgi:hypothetical protein